MKVVVQSLMDLEAKDRKPHQALETDTASTPSCPTSESLVSIDVDALPSLSTQPSQMISEYVSSPSLGLAGTVAPLTHSDGLVAPAALRVQQWRSLTSFLGRSRAVWAWQRGARLVRAALKFVRLTRALVHVRWERNQRRLALAMGTHPRLGAASEVRGMSGMDSLFQIIYELAEECSPSEENMRM